MEVINNLVVKPNITDKVYIGIKQQYQQAILWDIKSIGKFIMSKTIGSLRRDLWYMKGVYYQVFANSLDFKYKQPLKIYFRDADY